MAFTNSPLVNYTRISPNRTRNRNHKIDTITIHCVVGQCSVEVLGSVFAPKSRRASSNYGIGPDGRIGMYCEEKDRSWCSSSGSNDHRAITIEVASDKKPPYAVTDKAYASLINLCADICKRNGIKKLMWRNDKSLIGQVNKQNMTVHRWFSATDCPGQFLMNHMSDIARKVNQKLNGGKSVNIDAPASIKGKTVDRGYFKTGDRNEGVYTYKQLLIALKKANIITAGVDNNNIFGEGTALATKQVQKAAGLTQDGYAGPKTIRACYLLLDKKL